MAKVDTSTNPPLTSKCDVVVRRAWLVRQVTFDGGKTWRDGIREAVWAEFKKDCIGEADTTKFAGRIVAPGHTTWTTPLDRKYRVYVVNGTKDLNDWLNAREAMDEEIDHAGR